MNAKEARSLTEKAMLCIPNEFFDMVKRHASGGHMNMYWCSSLSSEQTKQLKHLGYNVCKIKSNEAGFPGFIIGWG